MIQILLESAIVAIAAFIIALMIIPLLIKLSPRLGLVDKPNHRKVHIKPVPVIGGISIIIATGLALMLSKTSLQLILQHPVLLTGSLILFIIGVWDDRKNVRPLYRLMLQLLCAVALAASGIRLTSLYGMFGIHEINIYWQYILTVMIIAGVTNAFNLMDGIDGLAGGLAFINLVILSILSFVLKQYSIFILLMALSGAIIAFLKNNINPAKIFMGDGGSLFLGFLMPSVGILLIEKAAIIKTIEVSNVVLLVSAILIVPVFDSLRVYMWRVQRGESPFKADKTHLHHLFLTLGLNHKRTSFFIYGLELIILIVGLFLQKYAGISLGILIIIALFIFITQLLQLNYGVDKWSKVIRKMESTD